MPDISTKKIRVVLADDHHILLDGIKALLQKQKDIEIAGMYNDGHKLLAELSQTNPDIAIIDINMPNMNGIILCQRIKASHASIHVIALSMYDDAGHIMEMIEAGISGYILKNASDKELIEAIKTVRDGKMFFSPEVSEKITTLVIQQQRKLEQPQEAKLTERELEILKLIAEEYSNAEIANTLFISERTVETHRKNMLRKTNNKSVVGLLKYAIEKQLI